MISHARTEMDMIRELASNEKAYRSITLSWFKNSSLLDLLKSLAENDIKIVVTTDHGSIRVNNSVKVIKHEGFWTREEVAKQTDKVFLFGLYFDVCSIVLCVFLEAVRNINILDVEKTNNKKFKIILTLNKIRNYKLFKHLILLN